jgi:hypothetical protein
MTPTPKERAHELTRKYFESGLNSPEKLSWNESKELASREAEQIKKNGEDPEHWEQVKSEIKKL